jgi:hypothetical protein
MNARDALVNIERFLCAIERFLYARQRDTSAGYAWTRLRKHINHLPRDARISDVRPKLLAESVRALSENLL